MLNCDDVKFYGLLHLEAGENSAVNLKEKNFFNQIMVYINNAKLLSNSLKRQGIKFSLLTNNAATLRAIDNRIDELINIEEIQFKSYVPKGVNFYSAHFKKDVYEYFSRLNIKYVAFCDLDVVCINEIPTSFINAVFSETPLYYDVTDQVIPAFNSDQIISDLEKISHKKSLGRWIGGEFISGPPIFFKTLSFAISEIYDNYVSVIDNLHHCSDETFTTSAVENISKMGISIFDAGTLGIIGRYWNTRVHHLQKDFMYYRNLFLLHLPADKQYLSKYQLKSENDFQPSHFIKNYLSYRRVLNYKRKVRRIIRLFGIKLKKN